jgi:phenylpropionate dioxygenase-like ring-hydroxylating dioxygenase large terminal subunit
VNAPRLPRATEIDIIERVLTQYGEHTTTMSDTGTRVAASAYVSAEQHQRERATVFRHAPVFACLSVDVAKPGDRFVLESGGVPIVVVRAPDATLRAYANVCRHRAAPLVRECGAGERSFVCPFHGWVYDIADGRLVAQPRSGGGFDWVNAAELGLLPLAVEERYGLVMVRPGGNAAIDVDAWLGDLRHDLGGLGYDAVIPYARATTTWRCNWKLLLDTFLESYHVPALHKASLGAAYIGAASPFDAFGPHNRIVVPQRALLDQATKPTEQWDLLAASVLQYFLAPNTIFSNLHGYVMTWRFVPTAADCTVVEHSMYTYRPVVDDAERTHFDARFAAARTVTGEEDFPESERVHASLASGMIDATVIGRNEPGVVHFHEMLHKATSG